jgi:hypothetical protein
MDLKEISEALQFTGSLEEGKEKVKGKTESFRVRYFGGTPKKEELKVGEDGEEILQIIFSSEFGEYEEGLMKILSKICVKREDGTLYEEPSLYEVWKKRKVKRGNQGGRDLELPLGGMIVPLMNDNGHSYPLNQPVLVIYSNGDGLFQGVTKGGVRGNFLPTLPEEIRPATDEEIDDFFEAIPR